MQKIGIIATGKAGKDIARKLERELDAHLIERTDVGAQWKNHEAFIFIGAMGICVRTIAPYVEDKHTDPAVVCVDTLGLNAVAVLSGHVGGANDLTTRVAHALGAKPIITTQSDNEGLWALDTFSSRFKWDCVSPSENMNEAIFAFVNKKPTALFMDVRDEGTEYLERTLPDHVTIINNVKNVDSDFFKLLIIVSPYVYEAPYNMPSLHFVPKIATIGVGLAHQAGPERKILANIETEIAKYNIIPRALEYCSIDVKANEPFFKMLEGMGEKIRFFTAEQLAQVEVPNPSQVVQKHVGTPSVCEAAAILGSDYGELIVPKVKGENFTAALAINRKFLRIDKGHIEIVGAGPGAPDLISVRGQRMLKIADLILYAGSLVPRELTYCAKSGAVVKSSADMNLEEQCELMKKFYDQGKFIVRLHTGDPCIFGAIQEQMAFFDKHGMSYHITPGISSFLAAAAELKSQFTIPEKCQTIILTRGEGRTPMPEREKIHLLAKSQSTMCIFLSASIVDDVQKELMEEYPADTPVAACYHLTWPDQRIYRGKLKDLAKIVHDNHLTLTTMIVVGEAIDNRQGLSELYSKHFTHLFRKGDGEKE